MERRAIADLVAVLCIYVAALAIGLVQFTDHPRAFLFWGSNGLQAAIVYTALSLILAATGWLWAVKPPAQRSVR